MRFINSHIFSTKQYLIFEILVLFFLLPVLFIPLAKDNSIFLMFTLCIIALLCIHVLIKSKLHTLKKFLFTQGLNKSTKILVIRALILAPLLIMTLIVLNSGILFYHPKENLTVWFSLWLIYPLFSALPQEVIYRTFIFKRYKSLLPNINQRVILSCLAFGFLHIVFRNWQAVVLSILASIIFCNTYVKSKSVFLVTLEHSCFGLIAYTTGIGYYFDSSLIS